jgi:hypothetical protein
LQLGKKGEREQRIKCTLCLWVPRGCEGCLQKSRTGCRYWKAHCHNGRSKGLRTLQKSIIWWGQAVLGKDRPCPND